MQRYVFAVITLFFVLKKLWKIYVNRCRKKRGLKYIKNSYEILIDKKNGNGTIEFLGRDFTLRYPVLSELKEQQAFVLQFYDIAFPFLLQSKIEDERIVLMKKYHRYFEGEDSYFNENVFIKKGDIVIDAGANIGVFSSLAASLGGIVYAFEPVSNIRDKYLIETAKLYTNINVFPSALSIKKGFADIVVHNSNLGGVSMIRENKKEKTEKMPTITLLSLLCLYYRYICKNGKTEKIHTITIDEWVEENNIPRVDFIKADIEGAERLLLKGAFNVLKNYAPKLSICTYHFKDDRKVLTDLILQANKNYNIQYSDYKLYAWVDKN